MLNLYQISLLPLDFFSSSYSRILLMLNKHAAEINKFITIVHPIVVDFSFA